MDKTIKEYDAVVLLNDLPGTPLVAGDTGIVVDIHADEAAFEVEFPNPGLHPRFLVETVERAQILKLQSRSRIVRTVA